MAITINCDMGEGFGLYRIGDDAALMPLIDIANVACGFHGGDFNHMRDTVRMAKAQDVRVGAHPSLPDLQGFGRREMAIGREELANALIYQIGALAGMLRAEGMQLNHIKPHGSLFGMAARQEHVAQAVCDAADVFQVPLIGMVGTLHEQIYPARGHAFWAEYYGDLDYDPEGRLIVTREHPPMDAALMAERVARAIDQGQGTTIDGGHFPTRVETICIHSDTPNAPEIAEAIRRVIDART